MNIEEIYTRYLAYPEISTDTRTITSGCIYVALKGNNYNGNTFALQALNQGAANVIVDELISNAPREDDRIIQVENCLQTLQDLARYHRLQLNIPFLGITGSNGKTTTKELIYSVLSEKFNTHATKGNLNNHIGVPLTILAIKQEAEFAIIEMGANHPLEIELLSSICQPSCGMITNVGYAHLEGFGGFEGVKKGKKELYDFLSKEQRQAFVWSGSTDLLFMSSALKNRFFYGSSVSDQIQGEVLSADPFLHIRWKQHTPGADLTTPKAASINTAQRPETSGVNSPGTNGVKSPEDTFEVITKLTGRYNLPNLLAAISIGVYFGLSPKEINQGLGSYQPANNRSQLQKSAHNDLILDFYNANPSSMQAALENLDQLNHPQKMVILGDMFELGEESAKEHEAILGIVRNMNLGRALLIGPAFLKLKHLLPAGIFFESAAEAEVYLKAHLVEDNLILIKGSRGIKLEKLQPYL